MRKNKKVISAILPEQINRSIFLIRGQKVMLDEDLARLYGVETRALIQSVKRNRGRFPKDFMFQLDAKEANNLRSQFVTSSLRSQIVILENGRQGKHRKYLPYVFTEQGVAMLSSVLKSKRAVKVNVEIMRAFVQLRQLLATHADLARKLEELEKKYDKQFRIIFDAIRELMTPPSEPSKPPIGFRPNH